MLFYLTDKYHWFDLFVSRAPVINLLPVCPRLTTELVNLPWGLDGSFRALFFSKTAIVNFVSRGREGDTAGGDGFIVLVFLQGSALFCSCCAAGWWPRAVGVRVGRVEGGHPVAHRPSTLHPAP